MSITNLPTTDPADPTNDMPAEPDPEWDEFTAHYRSCLSCRRLGWDTDLPLVCATADQILDAILTPLSVAIEASDDYAALCRAMESLEDVPALTARVDRMIDSCERQTDAIKALLDGES